MKQIGSHTFVETGYLLSNVGCIKTAKGNVTIDCPALPAEIEDFKKELIRIDRRDVAYSIITDQHYDHSFSTYLFSKHTICHKLAIKGILYLQDANHICELIKHDLPEEYEKNKDFFRDITVGFPEMMFRDELTLNMGDCTLELRHHGGHASATTSIYIPEDKVLFTGDNFENMIYPFTGEARYASLINALKYFESSEAEILVPGHGEICGKEPLIKLRRFLEFFRDQVKGLKKEDNINGHYAGSVTE